MWKYVIMESATKYDKIVNFFLDNWIISIIVFVLIVIAFIPSLRDGLVEIYRIVKKVFNRKEKDLVIEYKGEKITFEYKTKSIHFDIVKINAITHVLGVASEFKWLNKYYPKYKKISQGLSSVEVNENESLYYDLLTIKTKTGQIKRIYFDISSFFGDNGCTSTDIDKFAREKIKEQYLKN